jgi:hypothetical protein
MEQLNEELFCIFVSLKIKKRKNMIEETKIHSKPQIIFKQLINGECNQILQSHKNKRLFKKLGLRS